MDACNDCNALLKIHWGNGIIFIYYVFFTCFCVANIITGIFVDTAISTARQDEEEVLHGQMQDRNHAVRTLTRLFKDANHDRTGELSLEEFEQAVKEDRVRMQ